MFYGFMDTASRATQFTLELFFQPSAFLNVSLQMPEFCFPVTTYLQYLLYSTVKMIYFVVQLVILSFQPLYGCGERLISMSKFLPESLNLDQFQASEGCRASPLSDLLILFIVTYIVIARANQLVCQWSPQGLWTYGFD